MLSVNKIKPSDVIIVFCICVFAQLPGVGFDQHCQICKITSLNFKHYFVCDPSNGFHLSHEYFCDVASHQ